MSNTISKMIVAAAVAAAVSVQADARTHSRSIIVESPSDLPEMAQRNSEAMYLHYTGDDRAILYLEQDQGRTLSRSLMSRTQRRFEPSHRYRSTHGLRMTLSRP